MEENNQNQNQTPVQSQKDVQPKSGSIHEKKKSQINLENQSQKDLQSIGSKKKKQQTALEKKQTQTLADQEEPVSKFNQCRESVLKVVESNVVEGVMMVITVYALYADDIRILAFTKVEDPTFYMITFLCLICFFSEFLIFNIVKPGYPLSFTFWMDFVSSVSLIFDIPWLSEAMFGLQLEGGADDLLKAGKVSRVTTRAARLVRFIRLIRLIRVGKLYKHAFEALNERVEKYMDEQAQEDDLEYAEQPKLNDKLIDAFADKDHHDKKEEGNTGEENGDKSGKKRKKNEKKDSQKNNNLVPQNQGKKIGQSSVMEIVNREYDERAKKFAFGKTKSTIFINPDVIGMDTHSDESEYGEKRKKNANQFLQEEEISQDKETKISKKLSDLTTKRVITLIFSVMISIPFFSKDTYLPDPTSFEAATNLIFKVSKYGKGQDYQADRAEKDYENYDLLQYYTQYLIDYHADETIDAVDRYPIINLQYGTDEKYKIGEKYDELVDLRNSEKQFYIEEVTDHVNSSDLKDEEKEGLVVTISVKIDTNFNAALSLVRTTFLIFLLSVAAIYFTKDSNELVLNPIERMLNKVKRIGANPLEAARMAEDEAVAEEEYKQILDKEQLRQKQIEKNFETSILETTIIKIGALLALGFGEAGSEIIAKNMNRDGAVNPMIAGRKIMAIFGFVAIRNFIDATEVLEEGVMIYANEIADIVHQVSDKYYGAANKNLGDCFLMVWKFKDDEFVKLNEKDEVAVKNLKIVKNYSDQSVIAFLKTIAFSKKQAQSKQGKLAGLIAQIKQKKETFTMHLGFGLHMGWGIEGAIGSEFKIDASYLSPNVNLASRLEYATKQYGVPILISGQLYRLLSHKTQSYMRQVDRVTVKGSKQPMDLYTCDMDPEKLDCAQIIKKQNRNKKVIRVVARHKKQERYIQIMKNKFQNSSFFEKDTELMQMRQCYTTDFVDTFHIGLDLYIDGFWLEAKKQLENAQLILQDHTAKIEGKPSQVKDGPSNTIIDYMAKFQFKAPRTWKGYRSLTDK